MAEKDPESNSKKEKEGAEAKGAEPAAEEAEPREDPKKEVAEMKDRFLRLAAEFDNYKKRVAKEIDIAKTVGRAETVVKLLSVVDEFELALESSDKEDDHMKGIALIYSNLMATLKSLGLKEIDSAGKFDPYKHEIMLTRSSDKADGSIIEVVRKGYMLNDIMLRPASVIISKAEAAEKDDKKDNKGE